MELLNVNELQLRDGDSNLLPQKVFLKEFGKGIAVIPCTEGDINKLQGKEENDYNQFIAEHLVEPKLTDEQIVQLFLKVKLSIIKAIYAAGNNWQLDEEDDDLKKK